MAGVAAVRSRFVTSAVRFLRQHGFDGLDIDWEYPGLRGGSPKDRNNLVMLCKELRQAFEAEKSGSKRLLLTAAVPAAKSKMDIGFNIRALDRYLDLWNLMTYDYHGPWAGKTGHNSPLHPSAKETGAALMDNVPLPSHLRRNGRSAGPLGARVTRCAIHYNHVPGCHHEGSNEADHTDTREVVHAAISGTFHKGSVRGHHKGSCSKHQGSCIQHEGSCGKHQGSCQKYQGSCDPLKGLGHQYQGSCCGDENT
nr:hypothetical protein BaRGS_002200 [Batillaria attramentaria]